MRNINDKIQQSLQDVLDLEIQQAKRGLCPAIEAICHIQGYCHALRDLGMLDVDESTEIVSKFCKAVL